MINICNHGPKALEKSQMPSESPEEDRNYSSTQVSCWQYILLYFNVLKLGLEATVEGSLCNQGYGINPQLLPSHSIY